MIIHTYIHTLHIYQYISEICSLFLAQIYISICNELIHLCYFSYCYWCPKYICYSIFVNKEGDFEFISYHVPFWMRALVLSNKTFLSCRLFQHTLKFVSRPFTFQIHVNFLLGSISDKSVLISIAFNFWTEKKEHGLTSASSFEKVYIVLISITLNLWTE